MSRIPHSLLELYQRKCCCFHKKAGRYQTNNQHTIVVKRRTNHDSQTRWQQRHRLVRKLRDQHSPSPPEMGISCQHSCQENWIRQTADKKRVSKDKCSEASKHSNLHQYTRSDGDFGNHQQQTSFDGISICKILVYLSEQQRVLELISHEPSI
jgi:hypothetical protein